MILKIAGYPTPLPEYPTPLPGYLFYAYCFPGVLFKIQEHHRPSDLVGWPVVLLDFEIDNGKAISYF